MVKVGLTEKMTLDKALKLERKLVVLISKRGAF